MLAEVLNLTDYTLKNQNQHNKTFKDILGTQQFEIQGGQIYLFKNSLNKAILVARNVYDAYYYLNNAVWFHGKNYRYSRNKLGDE